MKILLALIISFQFSAPIFAQPIDSNALYHLKIEQKPFYTYKDKDGNILGCNGAMECDGINIVFYSIRFDKHKEMLFLRGRTYNPIMKKDSKGEWVNDTLAVTGIVIASGKLKGGRVHFYGKSFYSYMRLNESKKNIFPFRSGDFEVRIKVKKHAKLFFIGGGRLTEAFDIGRLL